MIEKNNFNEIEGKEILNKLFNKELNSKKNILEAIEIIRPLAKEELKGEKLQEIYNIIYNSIEDMNTIVKANTIMYLKNQLNLLKIQKPIIRIGFCVLSLEIMLNLGSLCVE